MPELSIQGVAFTLPDDRYAAGHVLTDAEAKVLNQAFLQRLRNAFGPKVVKALHEKNVTPEGLQRQFAAYAAAYQLGNRGRGGAKPIDPVALLADKIARGIIRDTIKEKALPAAEWPPERVAKAAQALLQTQGPDGKILTSAKRQLIAEQEAATAALDAIGTVLSVPVAAE